MSNFPQVHYEISTDPNLKATKILSFSARICDSGPFFVIYGKGDIQRLDTQLVSHLGLAILGSLIDTPGVEALTIRPYQLEVKFAPLADWTVTLARVVSRLTATFNQRELSLAELNPSADDAVRTLIQQTLG